MSLSSILCLLLAVVGVLLMFVILLQRGRGGGLAGAFGGLGGQSAFGTKAGDVFTRITIGMAVVWVALAAGAGFAMRWEAHGRFQGVVSDTPVIGAVTDGKADEKGEKAFSFGEKQPENDAKGADDKGGLKLPGEETKPAGEAKKPESDAAPQDAPKSDDKETKK